MIAIAPASFAIDLPERVNYISMGVGCCCFIHAIGMREPDNRIKQIAFPHLFYLVILWREQEI